MEVTIFGSQFLTDNCQGPPLVAYKFHVYDYSVTTPKLNETWSPMYKFIVKDQPYYLCGSLSGSLLPNTLCCHQSIDLAASHPYKSATQIEASEDSKDAFLSGANGASYCHLISKDYPNALFGYHEAYYLASGTCIDGRITCDPNGQLSVFPKGSECSGTPEKFQLSSKLPNATSVNIGKFTAEIVEITGIQKTVGWIASHPLKLFAATFKDAFEIFGILCYIAAIIISISSTIVVAKDIYQSKKRKNLFKLSILVMHILWTLNICLMVGFWVHVFGDIFLFSAYLEVLGVVTNLSTLMTVLLTCNFFIFEFANFSTKMKVGITCGLVASHIIFAGSHYLIYLRYVPIFPELVPVLQSWDAFFPYWTVFYVNCDNIGPLYVINLFLKNQNEKSTIRQRVMQVFEADKWIIYAYVFQVVLMTSYFITGVLSTMTSAMGSDAGNVSIQAYFFLCLVTHTALMGFIGNRLKVVLKFKQKSVVATIRDDPNSFSSESAQGS